MTAALRCACALALVCLLSLLLPPEGALGAELHPQEPRVPNWFLKLFGSFKKSQTQNKPANATKSPPLDTTKFLPSTTTKHPLPTAMRVSLPNVATKAPVLSPVELLPPASSGASR